MSKEELVLLIDLVNRDISSLMDAIKILPKNYSKDKMLNENISKIVEAGENIYKSCNISPNDKRTEDLKSSYTELKKLKSLK